MRKRSPEVIILGQVLAVMILLHISIDAIILTIIISLLIVEKRHVHVYS